MIKLLAPLIFLLMISCDQKPMIADYKVVYKNDRAGNAITGSKNELITSIRAGASIKVGWGFKGENHSIEHLSEPIWIAILDEKEVVVHLDAQVLSKTDWDNLTANYSDSTLLDKEWRVAITTKGEFDAVWYDRKVGEITNRRPQNHTITWFARGHSNDSVPLYLAE